MLTGESFASFWERLTCIQNKYCLATGVSVDNTVFKRNLREGICHRPDLLDEADKQVNASMDVLLTTLSNVDAGRRRRQAQDNHGGRRFTSAGYKADPPVVFNKLRDDRAYSPVHHAPTGGSRESATNNGETHPLPHDSPQDGDKRWHYKGNAWKTFCANPGQNRFTYNSSRDCPLRERVERERVKMT
jgi:hypothetical protein